MERAELSVKPFPLLFFSEEAVITLTITPDYSWKLKTGNSRTFILPDADVTASGEFEEFSSASIGVEFNGIATETIDLTATGGVIYWYQTLTVTVNGDYDSYLRVRNSYGGSSTGTYGIVYNTEKNRPGLSP